ERAREAGVMHADAHPVDQRSEQGEGDHIVILHIYGERDLYQRPDKPADDSGQRADQRHLPDRLLKTAPLLNSLDERLALIDPPLLISDIESQHRPADDDLVAAAQLGPLRDLV